jgi:SAM-dependent methyltransferase
MRTLRKRGVARAAGRRLPSFVNALSSSEEYMAGDLPSDSWNDGNPYDLYMGRWSRLVASEFLAWLSLPPGLRWLDVGCGTGSLTAAIVEKCRPAEVVGIEPSEGFVTRARERLRGSATFHVANALHIPLPSSSLDVVVSGLVLNFVSDPVSGLIEMKRVARPGATVATYVWDYAGKMQLIRIFWDAVVELSPHARDADEGVRFPICQPPKLVEAFATAGLIDVEVAPIEVQTRFRDFDDYWNPFLGGQGPAPSYAMSLDGEARLHLRERLRQRLTAESDGSIALVARAWGVRSRVPT